LAVASSLLAVACAPKLPPEQHRDTYQVEVTNPQDRPLNVMIDHVDGTWALGTLPAHQTRRYELALLQAQPVFVVGTEVDSNEELRQTVYLTPGCIARVLLKHAPALGAVAVADSRTARSVGYAAPPSGLRYCTR
jgi:hypothetical protein